MTTTGATATLPVRRPGRSTPVTLLLLCLGLLTTLQAVAIGQRNPISDTLSSYVYVPGGWMFGAALLVLAVGLVQVSRQVRTGGLVGFSNRLLLRAAALSSVLAAVFPADPGDADVASAFGEIHKWGSIGLLALAAAASLLTLLSRVLDRRAARAVSVLLATSSVSGIAFLGGQVSKWSAGGAAALADQAPWAGGLSQRILVVCLVCTLIVISDALLPSRESAGSGSAVAGRSAPTIAAA